MSRPFPLTHLDYSKATKQIESFFVEIVSASSAEGVVIGLSGGLDSSVAMKLAVDALGSSRVFGLILPTEHTPREDIDDAKALARELRVRNRLVNIAPVVSKFIESIKAGNRKIKGNLTARVRMTMLYHEAALQNYLVCGTSDKSELLLGYFTKYGDGAADLMPLASLYKTQVRELGRHLKLPKSILEKKSSPRLWKRHFAESELGSSYEVIDPMLDLLEKNMTVSQISDALHESNETVSKIKSMVDSSAHKRMLAASPRLKLFAD